MIFNNQAVRYLMVAVAGYIIDFGGFWLLSSVGFSILKSNVVVKFVAVVFGFVAHRTFTYRMKNSDNVAAHAFKYFGLALINTPLATIVLYLLMQIIQLPLAAKFAADLIVMVGTYFITSKLIFSKKL